MMRRRHCWYELDPTPLKRSIRISGHSTSISLEQVFWELLRQIAESRSISLSALVSEIDQQRQGSLSASLRLFVLSELINANQCGVINDQETI